MSESGEKSFEATPRRLARAKREGNVARSSELAANVSFAAAALGVVGVAGLLGSAARGALAQAAALQSPAASLPVVGVALVPVGCAAAAGALAAVLQTGGLTFVPIAVKIERLNPLDGLRRVLSRETLGHSLRAALAFGCAIVAMLPALVASASAMMRASSTAQTVASVWDASQQVAIAAGAVGLLFSIAEYGAARTSWLRKLRMSYDERKREQKEEEGDAVTRGRRRARHRALLRGGVGRIKEAAFVVTNPSHVAVALAYAPPRVVVPRILVRAAGEAAARVRELAASYGIPIVENVVLARALYRDGRAGESIPHAHYLAVAEVVLALMRARELAR